MSKFRMFFFAVVGILDERHDCVCATGSSRSCGRQCEFGQQVSRIGRGYWFRNRGVWWRARSVAHRCGSLRRRGAKSGRCRPNPDDDDSGSGADRIAGAVCAAGCFRSRQTELIVPHVNTQQTMNGREKFLLARSLFDALKCIEHKLFVSSTVQALC